MPISNCSSCGHDSYADPVTGVVTRRDEVTGQAKPASVGLLGREEESAVNITLSKEALKAIEQSAETQKTETEQASPAEARLDILV